MKNALHWTALVLVLVGALNWGLVGLFDFNIVETLFGAWPTVATVVYALVGLGALYMIYEVAMKK